MLKVARSTFSVLREAVAPSSSNHDPRVVHQLLQKHAKSGNLDPYDRLRLAVASARWALTNPYQGNGVALLGEVTGEDVLKQMRDRMLESESGRTILRNRTPAFDESNKAFYKRGTVGELLHHCVPEERARVTLVKDPELAFIMRRYRDAHDIIHALTGFPVTVAGEIALKWYESAATRLPMTTLSAVFGLARVEPNSIALLAEWIPWAATAGRKGQFYLSIPYSDYLHYDVDEFRQKIMQWPPMPPSLSDNDLLKNHFADAISQAEKEGRDAKALKEEAHRLWGL